MRILFSISILFGEKEEVKEVIFEKEIEMEVFPPLGMRLYLFDVPGHDSFEVKRDESVSPSCQMNKRCGEYQNEDMRLYQDLLNFANPSFPQGRQSDGHLYWVALEQLEWEKDLELFYKWAVLREVFIQDGWKETKR